MLLDHDSKRGLQIIAALFSLLFISSCTPTTGTHVLLSKASLSEIESLGIVVEEKEQFSVRFSQEQQTATPAVFFGLLGAAIDSGVRASADAQSTDACGEAVKLCKPSQILAEALCERLVEYASFKKVINATRAPEVLDRKQVEGVLSVTLCQWGLRLCPGTKEDVAVGFEIHSTLTSHRDMSIRWDRQELYLDGMCRPMQEFQNNEQLLMESLTHALQNLAGKIANEICYP